MSLMRRLKVLWDSRPRMPQQPAVLNYRMEFETFEDISSEEHARKFLSIILDRGGPFTPTRYGKTNKARPVKFDPKDLDGPVSEWRAKDLWLYAGPIDEMPLLIYAAPYGQPVRYTTTIPAISITVKESRFEAQNGRIEDLPGLSLDLYNLLLPAYAYTHLAEEEEFRKLRPIEVSIPDIYWLTFFGKPYVEMLGAERLRTAPCHRVKEMSDGGFMLMLTPTPQEAITKEGRAKAQVVKEHLGAEYFYQPGDGTCWGNFKRRTIPQFDWSRMAQRPPPTFELKRPFDDYTYEQFIQDVPRLVEDLRRRVADGGVQLDYSSKSLRQIDYWLEDKWEETTDPRFWESPELWRELCAYLGEVVRQAAGGEWKVEEVRPGERAAVLRVGKLKRQFLNPLDILTDVLLEGIEEASSTPGGILSTGLVPTLSVWMSSHKPLLALKDVLADLREDGAEAAKRARIDEGE